MRTAPTGRSRHDEAITAGAWWVCRCGRKLYEHSRRRVPNAGIEEYTCGATESRRFESQLLPEFDYDCAKGLHRP